VPFVAERGVEAMSASSPRVSISWRARAIKVFLRIIRRRRIYASVAGLMDGIAQVRSTGPARPSARLLKALDVSSERVGACDVYTLRSHATTANASIFLYLHGGAYCRPITRQHWSFLHWLVEDQGCTVMVPLYPLAPESQCLETLRAIREVHALLIDRHGRVDALMGDSAGAGLCLALCQELRDSMMDLPGRMTLISPWVDATLMHDDIPTTARRDPMLGITGIREAGRLYAGALPLEHPLVSPLRADLRGLPPMQVFVGTDDVLCHDAVDFVNKARKVGCAVELHLGHGMVHVWPLLPLPEARVSRDAVSAFLRG
jgi:monoterpene epsilon-lactone hydrolase